MLSLGTSLTVYNWTYNIVINLYVGNISYISNIFLIHSWCETQPVTFESYSIPDKYKSPASYKIFNTNNLSTPPPSQARDWITLHYYEKTHIMTVARPLLGSMWLYLCWFRQRVCGHVYKLGSMLLITTSRENNCCEIYIDHWFESQQRHSYVLTFHHSIFVATVMICIRIYYKIWDYLFFLNLINHILSFK